MPPQTEKADAFRQLHERPGLFVMPNPWDVGTARILESLGFEALATTSAGFAFSHGRRDYNMGREAVLEHCRVLVAATTVPLNADLENGFGDDPSAAAETIRLAVEVGLAGGSIEDSTGRPENPIYDLSLAVERVQAAAEAARQSGSAFVFTARCENYLHQRPDLADTIRRLQAYQEAGADVLYAPGLKTAEDIATVLRSIDRPFNLLMGMPGISLNVGQLSSMGVKRVSTGGSLARAAFGAFVRAAREMHDSGTFQFNDDAIPTRDINSLLQ